MVYNSVEGLGMTVTEALQLIVDNQDQPALNYAVNYAKYAINMDPHSHEFKVQLLYILSNMTHWRANKNCKATANEIKECRRILKEASK